MKAKTTFVCQACGQVYARWQGRCDGCGKWNTIGEEMVKAKEGELGRQRGLTEKEVAELVWSVGRARELAVSFSRFSTGIEELDRCLGSEGEGKRGMVRGSVVLVGGEPGIGKSTLLTQVVLNLARGGIDALEAGKKKKETEGGKRVDKLGKSLDEMATERTVTRGKERVLYVCGEESPAQINLRIGRLLKKSERLEDLALDYVLTTDADIITGLIRQKKPKLVIVDSIQTLTTGDLQGQAGSLGQVKETAERIAKTVKSLGVAAFLVGHVTKEGEIAGPKVLEHLVDAIFELSGERSGELRFLRTLKNRFGATDEVGVFKMAEQGMEEVRNPSEYFLQDSSVQTPGSGVVCILEGTRPLLTEVQALVVPSQLAMPRRVGRGVDISRVQVLAAVLQKHCGLPLGVADIFLSVVGGMKVSEAGIDLGLAVALASSLKEKALPEKTIFIGEVGLMGEIRGVSAFERRVKEAKRLGYERVYSCKTQRTVKGLLRELGL